MIVYKDFIANQLKGKTVRFICDCIIKMDIKGLVADYEITNNEIIYIVDTGDKILKIGENTPKLKIEL